MARSDFIPEPPKVPFWPFLTGFGLLVLLAGHLVLFSADSGSLSAYLVATLALAIGSTLPAVPLTVQLLSRRSIRRALSSQVSLDLIQTIEKSDQLMERMERLQRESNVQKLISDNLPQIVADKFEVVRREVGEVLQHFETRFGTLIDSRIEGVVKSIGKEMKGLHGVLEEGFFQRSPDAKPKTDIPLEGQEKILDALKSLEIQLRAMNRPGRSTREEQASKAPATAPGSDAPPANESETPDTEAPNQEAKATVDDSTSPPQRADKPQTPRPSAGPTATTPDKKPSPGRGSPAGEASAPPTSGSGASPRVRPAHLIVSAFVGGTQRIYIRGDGPGMSEDHGIPLTMSGIGEWSWVSPLDEAFRFTLWLDNKTADQNGEMTLEPGERKVVEPRFGEE